MPRVRKVYRTVLEWRELPDPDLEGEIEKPRPRRCEHIHFAEQAAHRCLSTRLHQIARRPLRELRASIEYSHSRHDWFPL
jgi:hypothetical protein